MNASPSGAPAGGEMARQRVPERMQQSADALRRSGQDGSSADAAGRLESTARVQDDVARALERTAAALSAAGGPDDAESKRLSEQLARSQGARDRLERLNQEMERLNREAASPQGATGRASGGSESTAAGQGASGSAADAARVGEEIDRELRQTRELLDELRRDADAQASAGRGFTFEAQGMTLSAPGTEAFKQDFARWEQLRQQATIALEQAESAVSQKLAARQSRDRLAAGIDDAPPADYQQQVDSYFKAIAGPGR
jgi:hypothetical protein